MLSLVFAVMMRGRPPIGDEFFIFYYTGIIPYHLFVHTSSSMTYAITSNGALLQLPLVGTFDVLMARGLLELLTDTLVAALLLAGFGALGLGALPHDLSGVSAAALAVWLLRLRRRLHQCRDRRILQILGQDLGAADPPSLLLLRHFLCAGNDAGLDPRHPGMEPGIACGRLVPRRASFGNTSRTGSTAPISRRSPWRHCWPGFGLERGLRRRLCEPL